MASTTTLSPLERLINVLRIDKRRSSKLSHFGAAIYRELFRFSGEHPNLGIRSDSHFAEYAGINPVLFSRYLTGERIPSPDITEHICETLECSYDRKIEIMSLIQQTPLLHRQLAEQKLQRDLLPFVSALEMQSTPSALSLATETTLPAINKFYPLLYDAYLKKVKGISPTSPITEPLINAVKEGNVPLLRGARLDSVEFPRRRRRPSISEI